MNTPITSDLILTSTAAKILGVSPDTVRLWERLGRLAATRTETGVRLFARVEVERLARERREAGRVSIEPRSTAV